MAYTPKRPRGYWNSITNVKSEVDDFIDANGLQPGIVPSLRDVRGADRSVHSAHDLSPVVLCEKYNIAALHRAASIPDTLVQATLAYHHEQLPINQSIHRSINQSINQSITQSIHQSINTFNVLRPTGTKTNHLLCLTDRCDLARAIEKWGGPSALAEDLAYGVAQRGARQSASKDTKASHSHGSQPDQTSILGSIDDDLDEQFSPTTQISATPAARARSIATTVNRESHRTHSRQPAPSRQQQDRSKIVSPLEVKAREKQPIVNNRRRIAIRRKTPKLPSMRQEMDEW